MATPTTSSVLRDANAVPIPQEFNNVAGNFEALFGENNVLFTNAPPDATSAFSMVALYNSAALEDSNEIKSSAGTLYKLYVTSTASTGTFYLHLFNATSLPGNGTTPVFRYTLALAGPATTAIDFGQRGVNFTTGIYYAVSTTAATLTVSTSADFLVTAYGA